MPRFQAPVSHHMYTEQPGSKVLNSSEWKTFAKRFKLATKSPVEVTLTEEMIQSPEYSLLAQKYSLPTQGQIILVIEADLAYAKTTFTLHTLCQGQLIAV